MTTGTEDSKQDRREAVEPMPNGSCLEAIPLRTRYTDREVRPSSNFVAHLMAIDGGYPQTRSSGRAEPDRATAMYRQVAGVIARSGSRTGRCC